MKTATLFKSVAFSTGMVAATVPEVVAVAVTGFLPTDTTAAFGNGWSDWVSEHDWYCESWACESASPTTAPTISQTSFSSPASCLDSCSPPTPEFPPSALSVLPSSPADPSPVPTATSLAYRQSILDSHNIHRDNASVPHLVWDDHMASIAAQIAASCVYAHDTSIGGGGYGQNIGAGGPPEDIPAMITNEMYNDEIDFYPSYGFEPDMSNFERWGHYSQIVWKSSIGVGCVTQYCLNGLPNTNDGVRPYFTVCNYNPPGILVTSLIMSKAD